MGRIVGVDDERERFTSVMHQVDHRARLGTFTDIVFHRPVPELGRDDFKDLSSYPSAAEDMKIVRIRSRKM